VDPVRKYLVCHRAVFCSEPQITTSFHPEVGAPMLKMLPCSCSNLME